jgi:7,8-dihydropterin-6-yl-methyl-4-(beta-D-ribofuranosyl)aminobenzene 5'-phosphate synthase
MIRITTVMDNKPSEHKALISKHGLSYYIETPNGNLLFDCGSDYDTIHNMKLLGINPTEISHFVGSHSHYDHVGGFSDMLKEGFTGKIYTGKNFFNRKMAVSNGKYTFLGIPFCKETLIQNKIEHIICEDILEVFKDCFLITNFTRNYSFEMIHPRFVIETDNEIQADLFEDELGLVLKTEKGLIVVVGCSHPGILNMLSHIKKQFNQSIYAVLGGTHLVEADDERLNITLDQFQKLDIKFIGLSHCSGDEVQSKMKERNMDNSYLSVGSVIMF